MTDEEAIRDHSRLVYKVANRYRQAVRGTIIDLDDLIQVGFIALIRAARKFDSSLGWKPSGYFVRCIDGAIKIHLREHYSSIRLPARVKLADRIRKSLEMNQSLEKPFPSPKGGELISLIEMIGYCEDLSEIEIRDIFDRVLAGRELRVAHLLLDGKTQREVARIFDLHPYTISRTVFRIRKELREALWV